MKLMLFICFILLFPPLAHAQESAEKPEVPVDKWARKTILLIGAHADDDAMSHGTLAMLQAHGNQIYIVTLTTGNVGTQDPNLSRTQLAEIRRQEELAALAELGISGEHYINLGYDDGLFAFDPGKRYQRWHKSDHRTAAYLAADAARADMWRLLFEGQIIQDGLKEYMIPEYMFYDGAHEDENMRIDIGEFVEKRVSAGAKYVSQFGPGWNKYKPQLSEVELKKMRDSVRAAIRMKDGRPIEGFRYYKGLPDSIGK